MDSVKPPSCVVDRWQLDSKIAKVLSLSPGGGNLVNKDHRRHFVPGMCFLVFLEPSRYSLHAGVRRLLQPSRIFHDLVHPFFANLWQSCHIPALLSTSIGLSFLSDQLLSVVPFLVNKM